MGCWPWAEHSPWRPLRSRRRRLPRSRGRGRRTWVQRPLRGRRRAGTGRRCGVDRPPVRGCGRSRSTDWSPRRSATSPTPPSTPGTRAPYCSPDGAGPSPCTGRSARRCAMPRTTRRPTRAWSSRPTSRSPWPRTRYSTWHRCRSCSPRSWPCSRSSAAHWSWRRPSPRICRTSPAAASRTSRSVSC